MPKLATIRVWIGETRSIDLPPFVEAVMTEREISTLKSRVEKYTAACTEKRQEAAAVLKKRLAELEGEPDGQ